MPDILHPAYRQELQKLTETLQLIKKEEINADQRVEEATVDLENARHYDQSRLEIREMLYASAIQARRNLALSEKKPYFTRIDFTETGEDKHTYYIGKYGLMPQGAFEPVIVDWRAPIANLYYSGQIGPMSYTAPDGEVAGELTLKRQFGIEEGELQTIFDTDIVSQDAYLQSVLGSMTGERLREIVTTIQAEQNYVIRYPLRQNLVVQGVAGSGKTTIALHRIAYLLYSNSETLRPEQMVILAPNPLFLRFIAGVLPDLGVERVRQTTFPRFVADYIGKGMPTFESGDRLESVLSMPEEEREAFSSICRVKGSARMAKRLDKWLDAFEKRFAEHEDIAYGPITLFTKEQIAQFLLIDEKPFPLQRRLKEFGKQLTGKAKGAARRIEEFYREAYVKKAMAVRQQEKDPVKRDERLRKMVASRDERIEQAKNEVVPFVKKTLAEFHNCDPVKMYTEFLGELAQGEREDERLAAERTLKRLSEKKKFEPEDMAPIALCAMRVKELPRENIRHIVVDEAQDFSSLEFLLLRRIAANATFTIVGDLMQGVNGWRGLQGWNEVTDKVFQGNVMVHHLVTSYRNTIEIMNEAIRVAKAFPVPGQVEAKPVLRHGDRVEYIAFADKNEQIQSIASTVKAWREKGMSSIAVIERDPAECKAICKKLPEELGAKLLDTNKEEYDGGLVIAPASGVKGLEFDGVLIADASTEKYRMEPLSEKILYVCLTRALHNCTVLYKNELTGMLSGN